MAMDWELSFIEIGKAGHKDVNDVFVFTVRS